MSKLISFVFILILSANAGASANTDALVKGLKLIKSSEKIKTRILERQFQKESSLTSKSYLAVVLANRKKEELVRQPWYYASFALENKISVPQNIELKLLSIAGLGSFESLQLKKSRYYFESYLALAAKTPKFDENLYYFHALQLAWVYAELKLPHRSVTLLEQTITKYPNPSPIQIQSVVDLGRFYVEHLYNKNSPKLKLPHLQQGQVDSFAKGASLALKRAKFSKVEFIANALASSRVYSPLVQQLSDSQMKSCSFSLLPTTNLSATSKGLLADKVLACSESVVQKKAKLKKSQIVDLKKTMLALNFDFEQRWATIRLLSAIGDSPCEQIYLGIKENLSNLNADNFKALWYENLSTCQSTAYFEKSLADSLTSQKVYQSIKNGKELPFWLSLYKETNAKPKFIKQLVKRSSDYKATDLPRQMIMLTTSPVNQLNIARNFFATPLTGDCLSVLGDYIKKLLTGKQKSQAAKVLQEFVPFNSSFGFEHWQLWSLVAFNPGKTKTSTLDKDLIVHRGQKFLSNAGARSDFVKLAAISGNFELIEKHWALLEPTIAELASEKVAFLKWAVDLSPSRLRLLAKSRSSDLSKFFASYLVYADEQAGQSSPPALPSEKELKVISKSFQRSERLRRFKLSLASLKDSDLNQDSLIQKVQDYLSLFNSLQKTPWPKALRKRVATDSLVVSDTLIAMVSRSSEIDSVHQEQLAQSLKKWRIQ